MGNEQLRSSDFVPFRGFRRYMDRNKIPGEIDYDPITNYPHEVLNEGALEGAACLAKYDFACFFAGVVALGVSAIGIIKGLELLLK